MEIASKMMKFPRFQKEEQILKFSLMITRVELNMKILVLLGVLRNMVNKSKIMIQIKNKLIQIREYLQIWIVKALARLNLKITLEIGRILQQIWMHKFMMMAKVINRVKVNKKQKNIKKEKKDLMEHILKK